jgi:hypothetical protein
MMSDLSQKYIDDKGFFRITSFGAQTAIELSFLAISDFLSLQDTFSLPRLLATDKRLILPSEKPILLSICSTDVLHAFAVPNFGLKVDAVPGRINTFWLYMNKAGLYYGQCSELCGKGHGFMPIVIDSQHYSNYPFADKLRFVLSEHPFKTISSILPDPTKLSKEEAEKRCEGYFYAPLKGTPEAFPILGHNGQPVDAYDNFVFIEDPKDSNYIRPELRAKKVWKYSPFGHASLYSLSHDVNSAMKDHLHGLPYLYGCDRSFYSGDVEVFKGRSLGEIAWTMRLLLDESPYSYKGRPLNPVKAYDYKKDFKLSENSIFTPH